MVVWTLILRESATKCSRGAVPSIEVCSAVARIGILAVEPLQTGTSEDVPGPLGCSFKLLEVGVEWRQRQC
jgi:hypothetical protein